MTALAEYQRLECPGLWRETPEGQRRDVIVSLGDATVMISDSRSEKPLSHWSLPAMVRLNPGKMPALFSPGDDAAETLEIGDTMMVAALEKVHAIIESRRPHPGRLRSLGLGTVLAGLGALAVFWLPGALASHAAQVLPFAKRQEIGLRLLADLAPSAGVPCSSQLGDRALSHLGQRLFDGGSTYIFVLPDLPAPSLHLPGGIILLSRAAVEDADVPDAPAGFALAEEQRIEAQDPLEDLLHWAGTRSTFRLLTTGALPEGALDGYALALLTAPPAPVPDEPLLASFRAHGVASTPYALARDPSGESVLRLIEADPFAGSPPPQGPVLSDEDWVALQNICRS